MGRMIDETDLMNLLYTLDDARHNLFYAIKKIPELPTVEAIPKADYKNRLKADMVAMLEELQLEIEEWSIPENAQSKQRIVYMTRIDDIIQQKIHELKENENGRN